MRIKFDPHPIFKLPENKDPGRANHEVQTVNGNTGIFEAESA